MYGSQLRLFRVYDKINKLDLSKVYQKMKHDSLDPQVLETKKFFILVFVFDSILNTRSGAFGAPERAFFRLGCLVFVQAAQCRDQSQIKVYVTG